MKISDVYVLRGKFDVTTFTRANIFSFYAHSRKSSGNTDKFHGSSVFFSLNLFRYFRYNIRLGKEREKSHIHKS